MCAGGCGTSFRNMPVKNLTGGDLHHVDEGLTKVEDPSTLVFVGLLRTHVLSMRSASCYARGATD